MVDSHGREGWGACFDYRYVPRDVTDRKRSMVSVDVCTDIGKHLENTVHEKHPCTTSFWHITRSDDTS